MKLLILLVSLNASLVSFGQMAQEGTYQLMTTNAKAQEVFSTDILSTIEAERQNSDVVIIQVGEYTWARVLPFSIINDPNFTPLSGEVIEVDPNDPILNTKN